MKKNVLIVEDQMMPSRFLELLLKDNENYQVAGTITDASNAIVFADTRAVDLILMDVLTNGPMTGLEASLEIKKKHPKIRIIIVTSMPECSYMDKAKAIGIEGFFYKDYGDDNLLSVMDDVMDGKMVYPLKTPDVSIGNIQSSDLTNREIEVLRKIMDGKTDREIADEMSYSIDTIHGIVKDLLAKCGFKTRTRLAVAVRESGFIINP